MYLFKINKNFGSLISRLLVMQVTNKSTRRIKGCIKLLADRDKCKVYMMPDYTKKMREMDHDQLIKYIEKHGKLILSQNEMGADQQLYPLY